MPILYNIYGMHCFCYKEYRGSLREFQSSINFPVNPIPCPNLRKVRNQA